MNIPLADVRKDDVLTIDGANYIVRDVDTDNSPVRIKVAAGRTDPGTWINPSDFESVTAERY